MLNLKIQRVLSRFSASVLSVPDVFHEVETSQTPPRSRPLPPAVPLATTQLMVRHSEIVNGNARLKKEIDHLRKERTTANEVHAQFEASIQQVRGEISGLMAQASAINDHREELVKAKEVRRESRLAARRLEACEGLPLSDHRVAAKL